MRGLFVGLTTADVIHYVDKFPEPDEKIQAQAAWVGAGGPAANAAATFAALGGDATLISALGNSVLADMARRDLTEQSGVSVVDLSPSGDIATSVVLVNDVGQRIVTSLNAAGFDQRRMVASLESPPNADVVCIDSHYPALVAAVAEHLDDAMPVVFDPGSDKPQVDALFERSNHIIASHALSPAGRVASILERIWRPDVRLAAVSDGPNPIVGRSGDEGFEVLISPVDAVDTLGAGDVLHGAYCYFLASGSRPVSALEAAVGVAGSSCEHHGPRLLTRT
jgi:sugar/nucleoside kinase (ribokinase family)